MTTTPSRLAVVRQIICAGCPHPCTAYLEGKIDHADPVAECPTRWPGRWHRYQGAPPASPATTLRPAPGFHGAAKWAELHRLTLGDQATAKWLANWAATLFDLGCSCQSHWTAWLATSPLPASDQFAWSVAAHNAVNTRLQRPIFTVAEALQRWCKPG